MRKSQSSIVAALTCLVFSACASTQGKFESITPGMGAKEVEKAMGQGPSRFEKIANTDYQAWYWGDQYCVLFNKDQVVAKNTSPPAKTATIVGTKIEEHQPAQCLAPGQVAQSGATRTINIPGIGTVELPQSNSQSGG